MIICDGDSDGSLLISGNLADIYLIISASLSSYFPPCVLICLMVFIINRQAAALPSM